MKAKELFICFVSLKLIWVYAGVQAHAQMGKMYWADESTAKIQRANLDGSNVEDIISSGLQSPYAVAIDPDANKIYWTDIGSNKIQRANLDGSDIEDIATGGASGDGPQGIALDLVAKRIYWADQTNGKIKRADLQNVPVANFELLFEGGSSLQGIALDVAEGKMYWQEEGVFRILQSNLDIPIGDPPNDRTDIFELVTSVPGLRGIALDLTAGMMYWTMQNPDQIRRAGLDVHDNGGQLLAENVGGGQGIQGIALDTSASKMYWCHAGLDKIQRANLEIPSGEDAGNRTDIEDLITTGLEIPRGIALDLRAYEACCLGQGICSEWPPSTCITQGGTPQGSGTDCTSIVCLEACCFGGDCCIDLDPSDCTAHGGISQGPNTSCASVQCSQAAQACCFSDGSCDDLEPDDCTAQGGVLQGIGTDCASADCPEACCFPNGGCGELPMADCMAFGGTPQGAGTTCNTVSCPQPEACCLGNGVCVNLTPTNCLAFGGSPQGQGADCSALQCPPPQDCPGDNIIFVDASAPAGGDGLSWTTAFQFLQDALAAAGNSSVTEVRVAQGTYHPDRDESNPNGSGDRLATFQLINGVRIRGGYAGLAGPCPDERDVAMYQTILSGDLFGNDMQDLAGGLHCFSGDGTPHDSGCGQFDLDADGDVDAIDLGIDENSHHIVTGSGTDETAVLDGFTVTAGSADGAIFLDDRGAGMINDAGSPKVVNCTFKANFATIYGSGMHNVNASNPELVNCVFVDGLAVSGAGMANFENSGPMVVSCRFEGNSSIGIGGAMRSDGSSPTLIDCTFIANAGSAGGAIYAEGGLAADFAVLNCQFYNNHAQGAGAIFAASPSIHVRIVNCLFIGNSADGRCGAVEAFNGANVEIIGGTFAFNTALAPGGILAMPSNNPGGIGPNVTIHNSILWANGGSQESNQILIVQAHGGQTPGTLTISHSNVQGLDPTGILQGPGMINLDPQFVGPGPDGVFGTEDDDLHLSFGSPCIDAGDLNVLPADLADLDADGDIDEPIPVDLDNNDRVIDGMVDMGAYESSATAPGITIDATALSPQATAVQGVGGFPQAVPTQFMLDAGVYRLGAGNNTFDFEVTSSGTVNYDPALEDFLDGAGTNRLTVLGFTITIDTTALSPQGTKIFGIGPFDWDTPTEFTLIPGPYSLQVSNNSFIFHVTASGTVDYDPALEGFLGGAGTNRLTVLGFTITIDTTALSPQGTKIFGIGPFDWDTPTEFTLIPGPYSLQVSNNSFIFHVTASGTVDYDPALEGFLDGAGTDTLTVHGFTITIDATALLLQDISIFGVNPSAQGPPTIYTLIPGPYQLRSGNDDFVFTLGNDGLISGLPDMFQGIPVTGNGTSEIIFGLVPLLGDMSGDGMLDMDDVPLFMFALLDPADFVVDCPECDINQADMNGDTLINSADIQAFIDQLLSP